MIWSMEAGEPFQLVQCANAVENLGVEFDGSVGCVDAGTAACGLFHTARMGSAVGTQKELRVATGSCANKGLAMGLTLQHG